MTVTSSLNASQKPNTARAVLGFDFGTTRIGVAVGQSITGTAQPLDPLKAKEGIPNWDEITRIVEEWK